MPKDYDAPDSIKLGKDLLPGDCIRGKQGNHSAGIIVGVNRLTDFYEGKPHYEAFDINCGEMGPYSGHLKEDEEFIVINSRREILRYYDVIELSLLKRAADIVKERDDLMLAKRCVIDRINNKLSEERKNEEV